MSAAIEATSRWLTVAVLLVVTASEVEGQGTAGIIDLQTNTPYASVYADDVLLGRASQRHFRVPSGTRRIELVVAGKDNWSIPPVFADLPAITRSDTLIVRLDFPHHYRIESTPFGAHVSLSSADLLLGKTPVELTVDDPLNGTLVLELDGYFSEEIQPGREIWNVHAVRMRPIDSGTAAASRIALAPPSKRKKWIDYAALGTAAAAGVVAVHYKFKADRRFETYQETGDPSLRPDIERYDVYSGVALGVMQAGLGLFAIRLIFR